MDNCSLSDLGSASAGCEGIFVIAVALNCNRCEGGASYKREGFLAVSRRMAFLFRPDCVLLKSGKSGFLSIFTQVALQPHGQN